MNLGVIFPQTEYTPDPSAIKDYVETAEGLGLTHIGAYDHILGANPNRPGGWSGPYSQTDTFLEPFVLYSYMAGISTRLGFLTAILVLPQRQTALVAKQAATLDILCGGRLRLGVGNGWNKVEFEALGKDFHNRGKRIEEQVVILRRLWTERLVTVRGRWHQIEDAGLNPLPIQKPIPIWFGGHEDRVLRRMARLGDGWLPGFRSPEEAKPALERLTRYLEEAARSLADFGLEIRLGYGDGDPGAWRRQGEAWKALGATHISLNTMRAGFSTPEEHLTAMRRFAETMHEW